MLSGNKNLAVFMVTAMTFFPGGIVGQNPEESVYSMERAIQVALANSQTILAAEQGVRIAGQQVREAWSSVLPDVSASASYSRNLRVQQGFLPAQFFDPDAGPDDVIPVRFGSDNTWNAGVTANQPLFQYNVFLGVSAASRFRSLEMERMRGTTQDVVTAVRTAYLDALLALEELRLTRNSVERVEQTLEETRALNRSGLASDYDVLRLEVEMANLVPNLRRIENSVTSRKRALLIEMGMEPTDQIALEGSLFEVQPDEPAANSEANRQLLAVSGLPIEAALDTDELRMLASGRRSNLRQTRMTINLEETRLSSQKAEYFPKLSLFSNYNVVAQTNGQWFSDFFGGTNSRTTSAVTGISVEIPIFQGFARDARVQQTAATIQRNEAQLLRLEKEIESQMHTELESLEESQLRVRSQLTAVGQARRGFEIASTEYREGIGSQLQVTDAELALRQSEFNYAQAVYDFLMARVRLDAAVGTVPTQPGDLAARVGSEEGAQ